MGRGLLQDALLRAHIHAGRCVRAQKVDIAGWLMLLSFVLVFRTRGPGGLCTIVLSTCISRVTETTTYAMLRMREGCSRALLVSSGVRCFCVCSLFDMMLSSVHLLIRGSGVLILLLSTSSCSHSLESSVTAQSGDLTAS